MDGGWVTWKDTEWNGLVKEKVLNGEFDMEMIMGVKIDGGYGIFGFLLFLSLYNNCMIFVYLLTFLPCIHSYSML